MKLSQLNVTDQIVKYGKTETEIGNVDLSDDVLTYSEVSSYSDRLNIPIDKIDVNSTRLADKVYSDIDQFKLSLSGTNSFTQAVVKFTISSDLEETKDLNGKQIIVAGTEKNGIFYTYDDLTEMLSTNVVAGWFKKIVQGKDKHGNILVSIPYGQSKDTRGEEYNVSKIKLTDQEEPVRIDYRIIYSRDGINWKLGAKIRTSLSDDIQTVYNTLETCGDLFLHGYRMPPSMSSFIYVTKDPTSIETKDIISAGVQYDVLPDDVSCKWCAFRISDRKEGVATIKAIDDRIYFTSEYNPSSGGVTSAYSIVYVAEYKDGVLRRMDELSASKLDGIGRSKTVNYYSEDGLASYTDGDFDYIIAAGQESKALLIKSSRTENNTEISIITETTLSTQCGAGSFNPKSVVHYDNKFYMSDWNNKTNGIYESDDGYNWSRIQLIPDVMNEPEIAEGTEGGVVVIDDKLYIFGGVIVELIKTETPHVYEAKTIGNINFKNGEPSSTRLRRTISRPRTIQHDPTDLITYI